MVWVAAAPHNKAMRVLMSAEPLDTVLGADRLDRLAALGRRIVTLDDPDFEDSEGAYRPYFATNGLAALLARPDFSLFGTVREASDAADLVDQFFAGLAGACRTQPAATDTA